jgi:glutaredoxin-like protein NrdH
VKTEVIVYTTKDCIECTFVKQMLTENNIHYKVRDISADTAYQKEIEALGFLGVPVTVYGNEAVKGMTPELQKLVNKIMEQKSLRQN